MVARIGIDDSAVLIGFYLVCADIVRTAIFCNARNLFLHSELHRTEHLTLDQEVLGSNPSRATATTT